MSRIKDLYDNPEVTGNIPVDQTMLLVDAVRNLTEQVAYIASGVLMTWITVILLIVAIIFE